MSERLTKKDWIDHGLRTLACSGVGALKVGKMASALKVSRGSFYWHFIDIRDFCAQLLRKWQERMTDQIIIDLDEHGGPDRLKLLMARSLGEIDTLDAAIRLWAAQDTKVAATVAAVDAKRISYIETLLVAAGVADSDAKDRARFIYLAYLGRSLVMSSDGDTISTQGIETIAALFEGG